MKRLIGGDPQTILLGGLVAGLFLTSGSTVALVIPAWFTICLALELLAHRGRDGVVIITMAPAAHLSTVALLPPVWAVPVTMAAAGLGALAWRRAGRGEAILYAAGVAAASSGASLVLHGVVLRSGVPSAGTSVTDLRSALLLGAAGVLYLGIVQGFTAAGAARRRGVRFGRAWKDAYGYGTEAVTALALIIVSILVVFSYEALGFRGVLLCVTPLVFIRDGSRRYLELRRAQARIIHVERLAAKGEMAAEIGHELNNYLAAISGRAQLLALSPAGGKEPALMENVDVIREISLQMAGLAKGLMDFSHRETLRTEFGVNELVERTVELVRPQARFKSVTFDVRTDPSTPLIEMDPGQIQQALLTLFRRAVPAAKRGDPMSLAIRTAPAADGAVIEIFGARGDAPAMRELAWDGEGGDATVGRIVERHHGKFQSGRDAQGEGFRFVLPAA